MQQDKELFDWVTLCISAFAGFGGSGVALMICRWFFNQFTSDFARLVSKVGVISEQLAVALVLIQKIAEHDAIIKEHEKKFAYLEGIAKRSR